MNDGYNTTVVLACGDSFRLNVTARTLGPNLGDYYECPEHSPIRGFDPTTGAPLFTRDQKVTMIERFTLA